MRLGQTIQRLVGLSLLVAAMMVIVVHRDPTVVDFETALDDRNKFGREGKTTTTTTLRLNETTNVTAVELRADERKRILAAGCEKPQPTPSKGSWRTQTNVLVSDRFKTVYCMVGKTASSTWKKVFLMAAGFLNASRVDDYQHRSAGAKTLLVLRPITRRRKPGKNRPDPIGTYFKFFVVRHPFDRLVSTFLDKFRLVPFYHQNYGREIVKLFRPNASAESLERGNDVTLTEFARFVVEYGAMFKDVHWTPQSELCLPCSGASYDFVGHYETLWEDGDFVLRRLGVDGAAGRFPRWTKSRPDGQPSYGEMLASVGAEYVEKLRVFYARDFELFGYT